MMRANKKALLLSSTVLLAAGSIKEAHGATTAQKIAYSSGNGIEQSKISNRLGSRFIQLKEALGGNKDEVHIKLVMAKEPFWRTKETIIVPGTIDGRRVVLTHDAFAGLNSPKLRLQLIIGEEQGPEVEMPEDCSVMFNGSRSIESIDFKAVDTSNVRTMNNMFSGLENLRELDIAKFTTDSVRSTHAMFKGCKKLRYVDITSFTEDQKKDLNVYYMFNGYEPTPEFRRTIRRQMVKFEKWKEEHPKKCEIEKDNKLTGLWHKQRLHEQKVQMIRDEIKPYDFKEVQKDEDSECSKAEEKLNDLENLDIDSMLPATDVLTKVHNLPRATDGDDAKDIQEIISVLNINGKQDAADKGITLEELDVTQIMDSDVIMDIPFKKGNQVADDTYDKDAHKDDRNILEEKSVERVQINNELAGVTKKLPYKNSTVGRELTREHKSGPRTEATADLLTRKETNQADNKRDDSDSEKQKRKTDPRNRTTSAASVQWQHIGENTFEELLPEGLWTFYQTEIAPIIRQVATMAKKAKATFKRCLGIVRSWF